jgi:hypothetical protein
MKVMQMNKRTWLGGRRRDRAATMNALLLSAGVTLGLAGACGGVATVPDVVPPETGQVSVDVAFGHELQAASTATFHVWVLAPKEGFSVSCSKLVAGEVDPYDKELEVLADEVFTSIDEAIEFAATVGEGVVYVEGVDFSGEAELAGCSDITVVAGEDEVATAEVTLITAGSYDCGDADTEDGSPCDDGEFCTTGEVCDGGSCGDGDERDCSSLADDCAAGTCSETEGCMFEAQPNDTPCDDGLLCTENDACLDGQCIGSELECGGTDCMDAYCDEVTGGCVNQGNVANGTVCDDGNACTSASACDYGTCQPSGNLVLCPVSDCAPVAACTGGCAPDPTYYSAYLTYCDDNPCMDYIYDAYNGYGGEAAYEYDATCDGQGNCVGGVPLAAGIACTIGCQAGTCDGSGSCTLTGAAPDLTSCSGTYPGSTSPTTGSCAAGECIY